MCEMEEHVMFAFITENLGTIVVGVLMLVAVTGIFAGLIKKRRSGKPVGCNCGNCPETSLCHKK